MKIDIEGYMASLNTIASRAEAVRAGKVPETYTEKLLASQNERVKKLCSEAGELVRENCRPDFDETRFVNEVADVYYSLEVMTAARGLSFITVGRRSRDVYADLSGDDRSYLQDDKEVSMQFFGGWVTRLVAAECGPEFDESSFVDVTANTLMAADFILSNQGMTSEPVFAELIRRNKK